MRSIPSPERMNDNKFGSFPRPPRSRHICAARSLDRESAVSCELTSKTVNLTKFFKLNMHMHCDRYRLFAKLKPNAQVPHLRWLSSDNRRRRRGFWVQRTAGIGAPRLFRRRLLSDRIPGVEIRQ